MSNILDYLDWRGDLKIDRRAPFCEVDNLILTQLSFVDLVGIADGDHLRHSVTLREAAARYLANPAFPHCSRRRRQASASAICACCALKIR